MSQHIDLVHMDKPEVIFSGTTQQKDFNKRLNKGIDFSIKLLNGSELIVTENMLKKYFVVILTEEQSKQRFKEFNGEEG